MQQPKLPTIYIDMDGVLADFNHRAREVLGAPAESVEQAELAGRWPEDQWQQLINDHHFYRHLPKTPWADQLIELVESAESRGYKVRLLTAIPRGNDMPEAFHDKIDWFNHHWPDSKIRVWFGPYSHDKHLRCQAGDILVDDRSSNCRDWREKQGVAIQISRENWQQSLEELRSRVG